MPARGHRQRVRLRPMSDVPPKKATFKAASLQTTPSDIGGGCGRLSKVDQTDSGFQWMTFRPSRVRPGCQVLAEQLLLPRITYFV